MKLITFILTIFVCFAESFSQDALPAFITDSLDNYVLRSMKKEQLPGLAVCIVKDGKVVLMKGYGVKAVGGNDKVDENTLFMIGSNTKAFTALAMAVLQEEGKLTLNDLVTKWLPDFQLENTLAGEQAIIRDLLCHRLGFRTFQGDFTWWKSNLSRQQIVEKLQYIKAPYPFRTQYGYCNAGFIVAGEIIPLSSGMSWEQFVRERFFEPLGMNRTLALTKEMPSVDNIAKPHDFINYILSEEPFGLLDNMGPAGAICSSVKDMSQWVIMLLNRGSINNKQIIPVKAIDQCWYPHTIEGVNGHPFNSQHFRLYGLGFNVDDYNGFRKISHGGAVTGFLSQVIMIPEKKIGVVVLTNSLQNTLYTTLAQEITDALLDLPYRNYAGLYEMYETLDRGNRLKREKQYADSIAMKLNTVLPLDAYSGEYENELYGRMQIVRKDDSFKMQFEHHPNLEVTLEPISGNRFLASFGDPDFGKEICTFTTQNDRVVSVLVKVADFLEYTPYVFVKK